MSKTNENLSASFWINISLLIPVYNSFSNLFLGFYLP